MKQGFRRQHKTRVCIEFALGNRHGVGVDSPWKTLLQEEIETLGRIRKRLRLWVELGGRLILVTH